MENRKQKTLAEAEIDIPYTVENVGCSGAMLRRLLDLGVIPGTRITALYASPAKNPVAYLIRGTVIAFRKEDSRDITIY